jgi:hypothetical protein
MMVLAGIGLLAALFIPIIKPAQSGAPEGKEQDATPKTRLAAS